MATVVLVRTVLQITLSPHVYPPSITKSTFLGDTLWQQCAIAFGYLENKGYCKWQGQCRQFPIIIGETGSFLHDEKDKQWMQVGSGLLTTLRPCSA